jgi:sugar phosphate isomerase/epimerase
MDGSPLVLLQSRLGLIKHAATYGVPLPDGEIDYRCGISAMLEAGYDGYLAVEGAQKGDQLTQDRRSLE